jgi:hypothetical protein
MMLPVKAAITHLLDLSHFPLDKMEDNGTMISKGIPMTYTYMTVQEPESP